MTSHRIELNARRINKLADASDLAEVLFPGNRNQQHAFLVIWFALRWSRNDFVTDMATTSNKASVSRRTLERVRAKLRHLGLIERISHFNPRHGGQAGWASSSRFERSLRRLADQIAVLRSNDAAAFEKDQLLINLADARRSVVIQSQSDPEVINDEL